MRGITLVINNIYSLKQYQYLKNNFFVFNVLFKCKEKKMICSSKSNTYLMSPIRSGKR